MPDVGAKDEQTVDNYSWTFRVAISMLSFDD